MISENQKRRKIIDRIKKLSDEQLIYLDSYLSDLEQEQPTKGDILSYAGIFKDLDQEVLDDLTVNLHERRKQGSSRIQ